MDDNEYYNSECLINKSIRYCVYCGQKIPKSTLRYGYDSYDYYMCTCEDAKKAHDIDEQIFKLSMSKPKKQYYIGQALMHYGENGKDGVVLDD